MEDIKKEIGKIKLTLYLFGASIVIIASMLVFAIAKNSEAVAQGHRALCNQKVQAKANVIGTKAFLKTHPNGFAGISPAVLERSLKYNEGQLAALKDITCS